MKNKWTKKEKKEYESTHGIPMPDNYRVLEINSLYDSRKRNHGKSRYER
jgi:hypothetical protein